MITCWKDNFYILVLMKYIVKLIFHVSFSVLNVTTWKCKVTHVACIIFLLDSTGWPHWSANCDLRPAHNLDSWFGIQSGGAGAPVSQGCKRWLWVQEGNVKSSIDLYLLHPLKFYILRYVLYRTVIDYIYINEYIDLYNSNINTEIKNAFSDRSYDQKYFETIV